MNRSIRLIISSCNIYIKILIYLLESGNCNEGDVRLVNGTVVGEGRLEVCAMGVWGRVCAQNFRKSAARIACLQNHIDEVEGRCCKVYTILIHAHLLLVVATFY